MGEGATLSVRFNTAGSGFTLLPGRKGWSSAAIPPAHAFIV
jgi:hypothetical protein